MPASHVNNSKHWRDRAAQMRALSDMMKDIDAVAIMLRLADDYEMLADRADARSNDGVLRNGVTVRASTVNAYLSTYYLRLWAQPGGNERESYDANQQKREEAK